MIHHWGFEGAGTKAACLRSMAGHGGPVVSVQCSDERIFSTSFDGTLRTWGWDGRQLGSIEAHDGHASGLALLGAEVAPGALPTVRTHAATGGDDGRLNLWDLSTEQPVSSAPAHEGAIWTCVTSRGSASGLLASADTSGSLKLWDLRIGFGAPAAHVVERAHQEAIAGMQMDSSETQLLSCAFDSVIRIWDLRSGLVQRAAMQAPPTTRCTRLAYNDTTIITGGLNGTVVVLDMI